MRAITFCILGAGLAGLLGCNSESASYEEGSVSIALGQGVVDEIELRDGRRMLRVDEALVDDVRSGRRAIDPSALSACDREVHGIFTRLMAIRNRRINELGASELAEGLRAMTMREEGVFIDAAPNVEAAERAIALRGQAIDGTDGFNPNGPAEVLFPKSHGSR